MNRRLCHELENFAFYLNLATRVSKRKNFVLGNKLRIFLLLNRHLQSEAELAEKGFIIVKLLRILNILPKGISF